MKRGLPEVSVGPKVIVIGIDGGCWDYIDPLLESGQLPNLQQLIDNGLRGILESTMPSITPPAWSAFITGKNPGKHGLFDFLVRIDAGLVPFSSMYRYGTPFWKYLNCGGLRVGIIGIPVTYPPEEVDGFMIAGFGAPENSKSLTYPLDLLDSLEKKYGTYKVVIPHQVADEKGLDNYLAASLENEAKQTRIALDLTREYQLDLLAINFQSADQFNHYSKNYAYVEKTLIGIDQNVGRVIEKFPDASFIVLSDHGSRRLQAIFLIRNWLFEQGLVHYLPREINSLTVSEVNHILAKLLQDHYGWNDVGEKLLRRLLGGLFSVLPAGGKQNFLNTLLRIVPYNFFYYQYTDQIDWEKTRIYELSGYGGFWVNPSDENPDRLEYEKLRQELIRLLSSIQDPSSEKPLIQRIYRKEELYSGPFMDLAPDLVADLNQSNCAFKVGGFQDNVKKSDLLIAPINNFGAHTSEGMFIFCGRDFKGSVGWVKSASIVDIPATILHLFGVPIPEDYDGRVLTEYISEEFMAKTPVRFQEGDGELIRSTESPFSQEEMEGLAKRLRELGYIG
jgi:predicted AlkP superfamily phosphohydrolase/phosphomutase